VGSIPITRSILHKLLTIKWLLLTRLGQVRQV